jgi:CHAD domain-containing protein
MTHEATERGEPLVAHLSEVVEKRLRKLERCLKLRAESDSVEAVHDLRVASRRLRAFGVAFRDVLGARVLARLEKRLKRVTKAAGAIRDWDVQIGLCEARIGVASGDVERASLEHLLERFDAERALALRKAEKRLGKVDIEALSSVMGSALEGAVARLPPPHRQRAHAGELLLGLVDNASEHTPLTDGAEDPERMHRLRIKLKELRYALELFQPVLGSQYDVLYERATALVDLLGGHHDLVVLGELVQKRGVELARKNRQTLSTGMSIVEEGLAAERQAVLGRLGSAGFEPDWWRENLKGALELG